MSIYVGMDVHRKRSQIAIVDDTGEEQRNRNLANDPTKLVPILGALPPGTPVAFDAGSAKAVELAMRKWSAVAPKPSRCRIAYNRRTRKSSKEIREVVSDRGRGVRSRGERPPTRAPPRRREPRS